MSQATFIQQLFEANANSKSSFPDKKSAQEFIDLLFNLLFIPRIHRKRITDFESEYGSLKSHLLTLVYDVLKDGEKSQVVVDSFFNELPAIYASSQKDASAISQYDPAAQNIEEVIVAYPGFYAIFVYRLSHQLWKQSVGILPRLFTEYAHSKTGIDIHPGASIGESFFIDHGTGIVIGETTEIGNNVKIYQGVTLGALNTAKEIALGKRHPTIEDNVIIYSGATILGGKTVIGANSTIGGNVWITYSVPDNSIVYHKSEIAAKDTFSFKDSVNEILQTRKNVVQQLQD